MKRSNLKQTLMNLIGQHWPLMLFCLVHIIIFLFIFQGIYFGYASKNNPITEYTYALQMHLGQLPFHDFNVEYPPLSMLFVFIPSLISYTYSGYLWAYIAEMLVFDLLGVIVIAAMAKERRLNRWKILTVYTLALLAIGPIITVRFDIIPAVIILLSVYALIKGHSKMAWAILAIGVFTKIYPVVLAPIFLVYQLRCQQKRQLLSGLAAFAVTSLIILTPALFLSPSGLWYSFSYHLQRGLQIESTYASVLELLHGFNLMPLSFSHNFGSTNLVSPIADTLAKVSFMAIVMGLLVTYGLFFKSLKTVSEKEANPPVSKPEHALLLNYSLLAILGFMMTSKVFSPQYLIWLLPLIPFLAGQRKVLIWLLFVLAGLMTFFVYPGYYDGIEKGQLPVIGVLVLRNAALVIMAFLIARVRLKS